MYPQEREMEHGDEGNRNATWDSRLKYYKTTLLLAYQSLGVVFGDLCTSPIFVYRNTFALCIGNCQEEHEILGVLSLVFWTLTIIPLCKYAVFVLGAHDNGEGGIFALYSLLCRHSKMGLLRSCYLEFVPSGDSAKSTAETKTSLVFKKFFEKYRSSRLVLFLLVLLGTSMMIADGILNPSMSVLSAVWGIKVRFAGLHDNYAVIAACIILVGLFALQPCGTHSVGFLFAPILITWLLCISVVGIYNIIHWNPGVVKAISPYYIYKFFMKTGIRGWQSLGGVVLCVRGAEAMFANLGHFTQLPVRIAFIGVVYPCLVLAYMGEAAYLSKHQYDLRHSFFKAIPGIIYWPVLCIATLATVVGSQATISATFSLISQCRALSCFPRVKVIHTSGTIYGQIYIPEVNWALMVLCLAVVGLGDTFTIGSAYGLAVISMMLITTLLMFLIMTTVWKQNVLSAALFVLVFGSVELAYFGACLAKMDRGGWLPLVISLIVVSLMCVWHYGTSKKQAFELENKISLDSLLQLVPSLRVNRVPGICLVYTDLYHGVPPMFVHFVGNFPAIHRILVFVTIQSLMVPKVPQVQRFNFGRIGPPEFSIFRCIIRIGYKDARNSYDLETQVIDNMLEFLQSESQKNEGVKTVLVNHGGGDEGEGSISKEVDRLMKAKEGGGVAYMMGSTCVLASDSSPLFKKLAINFVYSFLRRNSRRPATALGIPHFSVIEVGMVYRV